MNSLRGLVLHGYTQRRNGRSEAALTYFRLAAELAEVQGDVSVQIDALRGWANSELDLAHLETAAELYGEAIAILRTVDDPQRLAHTLRHLADVRRRQGENRRAEGLYHDALLIYRSHDATDRLDLGNALRGLALVEEAEGLREQASGIWAETLSLYEAVGVKAGIEEARSSLARLSHGQAT